MLINNALWAYLIDLDGDKGIHRALACGYSVEDYRETREYYMHHRMSEAKKTSHKYVEDEDIIILLKEGKTKSEVARILDYSPSTITKRLRKIKKELLWKKPNKKISD